MHAGDCNLWAVPQPRPSTGALWADSDAAEGAGEGGLQIRFRVFFTVDDDERN